jgi:hypothetical protein
LKTRPDCEYNRNVPLTFAETIFLACRRTRTNAIFNGQDRWSPNQSPRRNPDVRGQMPRTKYCGIPGTFVLVHRVFICRCPGGDGHFEKDQPVAITASWCKYFVCVSQHLSALVNTTPATLFFLCCGVFEDKCIIFSTFFCLIQCMISTSQLALNLISTCSQLALNLIST